MASRHKGSDEEHIIEEFEELTKNAGRVQRETLKKILQESSKTEYLQKYGLREATDPTSFKACVPLVSYEDVKPYIQRIIAGENSGILTGRPVTALTSSSGTSGGKRKILLFNDEFADLFLQMYLTSLAFRNREFPIIGKGKALHIFHANKYPETEQVLPFGSVKANIFRTLQIQNRFAELQLSASSPDEVTFGHVCFKQSLYCHLLSGLIYRDQIQFVYCNFAYGIVHAFGTFEEVWEELCYDIQRGFLNSRISSPSARVAMSKLLPKPNPKLAGAIREICACSLPSNWCWIIPKLFPNAKYIHTLMTGSMQPYLKKLRHYASENLPLVNGEYVSSEARIGANVNPKSPPALATFAIIPNAAYYEFIPTTNNEISELTKRDETRSSSSSLVTMESDPVGLTEVKVGQEYEIVVTNSAGLYRYRLGDLVKITGFHKSTPLVRYVSRSNFLLSVNIDKTTEKDLMVAVEEASKLLLTEENLEVVDFTSRVERATGLGHYVIIWELSGEAKEEILKQCSNVLDKSFRDACYIGCRKHNVTAALELQVVRSGTFQKIAAHCITQGASFSQFKTPRRVGPTNAQVLQILSDNVVGIYVSTAYD